jgi:hypothetical protein
MKSYIVDTFFGIFAIDESGDILEFIDFEDDHEKIIDFYNALDSDIIQEEFEIFLSDLKTTGFDEFIFDNKQLEFLTSEQLDYKTSYNFKSVEIGEFRENLEAYLKKVGINKTREEILTHIEEIEDKLTKRKSH